MKELEIRLAKDEDRDYFIKWLQEPGILKWFPMCNQLELEDAVRAWMSYVKYNAVLTAVWNNEPCGIANLYLQSFKKIAHQSLFAIIVAKDFRGKGVGTALLNELFSHAKNKFNLEYLHLEVYEKNPAIALYKRLGFIEFGYQKHFIKENGKYLGKHFMQKKI